MRRYVLFSIFYFFFLKKKTLDLDFALLVGEEREFCCKSDADSILEL